MKKGKWVEHEAKKVDGEKWQEATEAVRSESINEGVWGKRQSRQSSTYVASMTTPTPVGCRASVIATAICLVNLSWTVGQTATGLDRTNSVRRRSAEKKNSDRLLTLEPPAVDLNNPEETEDSQQTIAAASATPDHFQSKFKPSTTPAMRARRL